MEWNSIQVNHSRTSVIRISGMPNIFQPCSHHNKNIFIFHTFLYKIPVFRDVTSYSVRSKLKSKLLENVRKIFLYQIILKSIHWFSSCLMRAEGRTDGRSEFNRRSAALLMRPKPEPFGKRVLHPKHCVLSTKQQLIDNNQGIRTNWVLLLFYLVIYLWVCKDFFTSSVDMAKSDSMISD
jgi:hypothetical protein